jgi:dimethylargininase
VQAILLGITRLPSQRMNRCQLTYVARVPIDLGRALRQHQGYCRTLERCGATVRKLEGREGMPDCAFVEDTAIVLDEVAVLASMGAASRRAETAGVEAELARYREVSRIERPATIEGGDVLRVGRTLLVGRSPRTNEEGVRALERIAGRFGYRVVAVPVRSCLHLKSACTALDDETLLVNRDWVEAEALAGYRLVEVDREEPSAANVARVGECLCVSAAHPRTGGKIEAMGYRLEAVELSEFAKAEGCVTCLSIVFDVGRP